MYTHTLLYALMLLFFFTTQNNNKNKNERVANKNFTQ